VKARCVFCDRLIAGEYDLDYPALDTVAFEPLNPVTPGHLLFVPKRHVENAAAEPWVTGRAFEAAASFASDLDFASSPAREFNLITSAGSTATQTIKHLHIHYVPRRAGDGLALPWTGAVSGEQAQPDGETR
jgi:diadenosine tetraphosphate (Ap4A) HIT family hydrolase